VTLASPSTVSRLLLVDASSAANGGEPVMSAVNAGFFQVLGIAGLIVAFLCVFFLDEPQGSFADHHEGEAHYADQESGPESVPQSY